MSNNEPEQVQYEDGGQSPTGLEAANPAPVWTEVSWKLDNGEADYTPDDDDDDLPTGEEKETEDADIPIVSAYSDNPNKPPASIDDPVEEEKYAKDYLEIMEAVHPSKSTSIWQELEEDGTPIPAHIQAILDSRYSEETPSLLSTRSGKLEVDTEFVDTLAAEKSKVHAAWNELPDYLRVRTTIEVVQQYLEGVPVQPSIHHITKTGFALQPGRTITTLNKSVRSVCLWLNKRHYLMFGHDMPNWAQHSAVLEGTEAGSLVEVELMFKLVQSMHQSLSLYGFYVLINDKEAMMQPFASEDLSTRIRTQKARGLAAIRGSNSGALWNGFSHIKLMPFKVEGKLGGNGVGWPRFVRPCPIVPRHGFIESRVAFNEGHQKKIIAAALKEDKEAEIVTMPIASGRYSAVLTPIGIAWGRGNDGATSGEATFLPAPTSISNFSTATGLKARTMVAANVTRSPYIELVEHYGEIKMVQLRDGPEQPVEANYIPHEVTVEQVLTPNSAASLLRWEEKLEANKRKKGTVVLCLGQTLASHYAVQAMERGISVICDPGQLDLSYRNTTAALKGKTLKPIEGARIVRREGDLRRAADWLAYAIATRRRWAYMFNEGILTSSPANPHDLALGCTLPHCCLGWSMARNQGQVWAYGVASVYIHAMASCAGELRHFHTAGPGCPKYGRQKPTTDLEALFGMPNNPPSRTEIQRYGFTIPPRNSAAAQAAELPFFKGLEMLDAVIEDFGKEGWGSHFGGPKWKECTLYTQNLGKAIHDFCLRPTERNWGRVVRHLNVVVHVAHNGNKLLTKWIGPHYLDYSASAPVWALTTPFVGALASGYISDTLPTGIRNRIEEIN